MAAYGVFARYYDALTKNVDYRSRAAYFAGIIRRYAPDARLLLDLACGTGGISFEIANLGYEVIGVDSSPDMLSVAAGKNTGDNPVMFLCQKMQNLDLYGTVDAAVCALDSLNHLTGKELAATLGRLGLFIAPGGIFVFDLNTRYKHREILADNCFVYEHGDCYCVWQNRPLNNDAVGITLDFFENCGGAYKRHQESFCEYIHDDGDIRRMLDSAGFELLSVFEADTENPPTENSERVVYAARRLST
ncbi:MAG: class I SAM-dependent methyltransferase [Oscillospiraceae bacterium]|nr:class I SAM-dependent methyltransferase [Oscillospiraceae bacterium]